MVKPSAKLSSSLPPLIFGGAPFHYQFNQDPFALGPTELVQRALAYGVCAFDTSPYYGPSEEILGTALSSDIVRTQYPREKYHILTKVGRIGPDSFDYSPTWIRRSVKGSCKRLRTTYLDVVYCHDVEHVSVQEVLAAVIELRDIRDKHSTIKYIGISGYPVPLLCDLAEMVLRETGEPLDIVQSYANFTVQNTRLVSEGVSRLVEAGVDIVANASPLGMGLLRRQGPPTGAIGNWHPAPDELRAAVVAVRDWTDAQGEKLELVAIRFALENWLREGAKVGTLGVIPGSVGAAYQPQRSSGEKLGVTVMGVSKIEELDETMRVWRSVLDGLSDDLDHDIGTMTPSDALSDHEWSLRRRQRIRALAKGIRGVIGEWADFTWASPPAGFINKVHNLGLTAEEAPSEPEQESTMPLTPRSEAADPNSPDSM